MPGACGRQRRVTRRDLRLSLDEQLVACVNERLQLLGRGTDELSAQRVALGGNGGKLTAKGVALGQRGSELRVTRGASG